MGTEVRKNENYVFEIPLRITGLQFVKIIQQLECTFSLGHRFKGSKVTYVNCDHKSYVNLTPKALGFFCKADKKFNTLVVRPALWTNKQTIKF